MILGLANGITTKSLEYDEMLRACNHKEWLELELHKERMKTVASELKEIRERFARAMDGASNVAFNTYKNVSIQSWPHEEATK